MPMTEAMLRAQKKYNQKNTVSVCMRVNRNTDKDVLEFLQTITNKRAYLLALIRKDMAERKAEEER